MFETTTIACPKCGADLPLNEALTHRLREQMGQQFATERRDLNAALAAREANLAALQEKLEARQRELTLEVARNVQTASAKLLETATAEAENRLGARVKELEAGLAEKSSRLQRAEAEELELRKAQRALQDAQGRLELEVARKLDEERSKIAGDARQQAIDAERLKLAEKEQVIKGLQEQIASLQKRSEQGSIQLQGETLEAALETDLRLAFPYDEIAAVRTGARGADIYQRIRTNNGADCGMILWEAKRARNWSGDWTEKLKEDQREAKAELAVLVSTEMPAGLRSIGQVDGVWVCEPPFAPALAAALRSGLVGLAVQRHQQTGRADKTARVYEYLCGLEFRHCIEAMVESFVAMREQLGSEQRAFARQWKEREQQILKALQHTAALYGTIQGIAGRDALPGIETLELTA